MRVGDSVGDGKISTPQVEGPPKKDEGKPRALDARRTEDEGLSPFARILQGLGREVDRGEALVRRAIAGPSGGRQLGDVELLALQAGVYRYSEAVDLSAKLVDRATSGVKTVLQGQ